MKSALIIGALSQGGRYLSQHLLSCGYIVAGTTHRSHGSTVDWPGTLHLLDVTNSRAVRNLIADLQPDEIYNLAARASSSQLFDDAVATGEVNGVAVARILDAIADHSPQSRFCQALSSEVFAQAVQSPQNELTPIAPLNAYGAAKAYAWHLVQAYRSSKDLFACGAILYNYESPLRPPSYVTRKITQAAARIANGSNETLLLGSGSHRRDWGHARDHMRALHLMLQAATGDDYIVATGVTHSVEEFCEMAFSHLGLDYTDHVVFRDDNLRRNELHELRGDPSKAQMQLAWTAETPLEDLVREMVDADFEIARR